MTTIRHLTEKAHQRTDEVCRNVGFLREVGSLCGLHTPNPVLSPAIYNPSGEYWATTDSDHRGQLVCGYHLEIAAERVVAQFFWTATPAAKA